MRTVSRRKVASFVAGASLAALAGLVAVLLLDAGRFERTAGWLVLGWAGVSVVGVAGGGWLVARHGTPGNGFLKALLGGILGRLIVAVLLGVFAASAGEAAAWAYAAGLVTGFLSVQLFEAVWFFRRAGAGGEVGA